ncbi:MAG: GNAT family N-acetyltransferase [Candidatus Lokiarchaeota archaeon]|nr:GNAT family N-acetyltransferase [Candidatus Lokiarchaeota archaeon]
MNVNITEYTTADLNGVIELNRSIISRWYHYFLKNGKIERGVHSEIEQLSDFELWYHGGPWNTPKMFHLYTKLVQKCNGKIFLAWDERHQLIGEVDCCLANNYDKSGYILWILTHPNYRRRGIGSQLIQKVKSFFYNQEISQVVVIPQDTASREFYQFCGFIPYKNRMEIDLILKDVSSWSKVRKKYRITPVTTSNLNEIGYVDFYSLIGSTESNNYIQQTALHRAEILEVLGKIADLSGFLPLLWKYERNGNIAIIGNVYQMRVWVNTSSLIDADFLNSILEIIQSLHSNSNLSNPLGCSILEDQLLFFNEDDFIIKKIETVLKLSSMQ